MRRKTATSGTILVEYVVMTGLFVSLVVMIALVLYTFKEYGGRVLDLVASEFP